MAAPSYTTDLTPVSTVENATNWIEFPGRTGGGAPATEGDYFIQGSACVSQSTNNKTGTQTGMEYDNTTNVTLSTDDCFFFWSIYLAANAIATWANGGLRLGVGGSSGNVYAWNALGNDFGRYPYGGWQNIAIDPTFTPDETIGTPGTTYRYFASLPNINTGTSKGNPHAVDAIRYGRGQLIITDGDAGNGYGTFSGIATQNDNTSNRWGLFQEQAGIYLWKGLMSFGITATSCDFRDSNVSITIDDAPRTYAAFNRIEITNASSRVDWTGVNITAVNPSGLSIGQFEMIDNATVNFDLCTFTDMSTFIFQSNATLTDTTFRRCGQVTLGGSTMSGMLFDNSTASIALLVANNIANVTNTSFESDGTGYALEGFSTAGDYNLVGITFTGYAATNGTTGNEAVHVTATTGTVNLNVSGGGSSSFSVHTAGATVNIVQSATLTISGVRAASDVWIYRTDNKTLLASADPVSVTDGAPINGVQYYKLEYTYNASTLGGVAVQVKVFNLDYVNVRVDYTLTTSNASIGIQQRIDRNYDNP